MYFHNVVMLLLLKNLDTSLTSVQPLQCWIYFPWTNVAIPVRRARLKDELCKGVQEVFIPMQRQYSSHMSMLMEKLLCQHRLLTGKVRVSSGGGGLDAGRDGWWIEGCWKDRGRDVITVGSPETSDTAVAAVHLTHLPLLSHFYWHKSFYRGLDRLFTLSVCDHPPPSIYLPVANSIMRCLSGRSCLSADCVLNDMSRTLQDHTRKISLSDIWSVLSKLGDVFCVHTYVLAFLYPACMCWHECTNAWGLYSLMPVMHDAPMRTHNEIPGGDGVWWCIAKSRLLSLKTVLCDLGAMCLQWCCSRRNVRGDQQTANSWLQQDQSEMREWFPTSGNWFSIG